MGTELPLLAGPGSNGLGRRLAQSEWRARRRVALRLAGGGLLIATGAIHLELYLTGYRSIPTIGWLFLLQVIAAFGLGVVVLVTGHGSPPRQARYSPWRPWGGYLLSLWTGMFGFTEVRTTDTNGS
jgi:hypothetical protein